jgi:[pyruvate, water dikinase]-phosphate phosphotransferase / [pyruvate, water dikinase] kinase
MPRSGDAGKRQHVFCGKIGDNTQKPNGLKGLFARPPERLRRIGVVIHVKHASALNSRASEFTATAIVEKTRSARLPVRMPPCDAILSTAINRIPATSVNKHQSFFHLHLISDATGETLLAAGRAASAQYKSARAIEHIYPLIRTERQLATVLDEIDEAPGIVLYTVVDTALAKLIDERCAAMGLPCVSVLEPVLAVFQSYLGAPAGRRVGAQHVLDAHYFQRIDALNFTMEHDDGQLPDDIEEAEIVLIGISRTSKTPTSIYLANRGIKTANVPIVLGVPVPPALTAARRPLIVGLVATSERISQVRQNRILGSSGTFDGGSYVDRSLIAQELAYARQICTRHNWPMIDVTRRSIEETAAAIVALRRTTR